MHSQYDDIDAALAEFRRAIGELFNSPERRRIELLKRRIAELKAAKKSTVIHQHQLCELMAEQIRREIAA